MEARASCLLGKHYSLSHTHGLLTMKSAVKTVSWEGFVGDICVVDSCPSIYALLIPGPHLCWAHSRPLSYRGSLPHWCSKITDHRESYRKIHPTHLSFSLWIQFLEVTVVDILKVIQMNSFCSHTSMNREEHSGHIALCLVSATQCQDQQSNLVLTKHGGLVYTACSPCKFTSCLVMGHESTLIFSL